ncbi:hypothetical protein BpHYR1_032638 [Brachionus plicatilis]|uniref:Uncharacterized protein n=1 Tax=Brachionus plicatilis TaxID=10195 RepID=A0A3M7Q352_BRAPC|nr:hypothetical protein BpHYR1_032638 [Brachionus plicatilis]
MNANTPITNTLQSNKYFEPTTIAAEQIEQLVNNMCCDSFTKSFDFIDKDDYLNKILIDEDENLAVENFKEHLNPVSSISIDPLIHKLN